ncbi:ABC transporter ATP-binding protein [Spiroplasma turonicum]|uniref:ABC transporter ATP-binding protein n=1 Tax=Spiroplasma turonicum TaxID=216946 RepID=A0A0K1P763_9MOLU|nr:ABC transporter ATP-binding protein [Spiroplasma turonicum]AKU80161.1 ABC transporter ATP-binding protein [Spiroplasma turonicum]ALX71161.1 ABC transporter ATP-binding protein [Spiroplasma turonicum]
MRKKFVSDKAFSKKKFLASVRLMGEGIKAYPLIFFCALFFIIVDSIVFTSIAIIVNKLITTLQTNQPIRFLFWDFNYIDWSIIGGCWYLFYIVLEFLTNIFASLFARKMEIYLRLKALKHLVEFDMNYYSKNQIGLTMSRVINDSSNAADAFNEFLINLIYSITSLITMTTLLFTIDVTVASIILVYFIVMIVVIWILFIYYRRSIIIAFDLRQKIDADITDRLISIRVIKSSGTENYEVDRAKELHKKYWVKAKTSVVYQTILNVFVGLFSWFMPIISILLVVWIHNDMESSKLSILIVSFSTACYNMLYGLLILPTAMRGLTRLSNCVMRLNYIYNAKSLIEFKVDGEVIEKVNKIEFKNVKFWYPDDSKKIILPNFDFVFEKGKRYALVGQSGVGKSTIARLLLRYYDVPSGEILIDGINIKDLKKADYLSRVGYVEQDPQILYGTIMDNLLYANFTKTKLEAIEASKKAKLHSFVLTLPDGYNTILGERGFIFSGGQKQRLVIARMILKNPEILILDEATSALDNIVEKEIKKELDNLMVGRTTIAIAHRLSTIKEFDQILVLDEEGISEVGTFNELKSKNGRFKKLYELSQIK